ncbi:MAG: hypothetical protein SNJ49_13800 [Chloracidobacterium sp.]
MVVQAGQSEAQASGNHIGEMALSASWTAYDSNLGSVLHTAWFPVQVKPLVTLEGLPFNPSEIRAGDSSTCGVIIKVEGLNFNVPSVDVKLRSISDNMRGGFVQVSVENYLRDVTISLPNTSKIEKIRFTTRQEGMQGDRILVGGIARILPDDAYVIETPTRTLNDLAIVKP